VRREYVRRRRGDAGADGPGLSAGAWLTAAVAAAMSSKMVLDRASSSAPAPVSATRRVVRLNRGVPSSRSSRRINALTVGCRLLPGGPGLIGQGEQCPRGLLLFQPAARQQHGRSKAWRVLRSAEPEPSRGRDTSAEARSRTLPVVRPGKSGGRYICELIVSLPDSSAA
jgi:hypothetical protein